MLRTGLKNRPAGLGQSFVARLILLRRRGAVPRRTELTAWSGFGLEDRPGGIRRCLQASCRWAIQTVKLWCSPIHLRICQGRLVATYPKAPDTCQLVDSEYHTRSTASNIWPAGKTRPERKPCGAPKVAVGRIHDLRVLAMVHSFCGTVLAGCRGRQGVMGNPNCDGGRRVNEEE